MLYYFIRNTAANAFRKLFVYQQSGVTNSHTYMCVVGLSAHCASSHNCTQDMTYNSRASCMSYGKVKCGSRALPRTNGPENARALSHSISSSTFRTLLLNYNIRDMMLLLHRATASKLASIISRRTCMPVSTHCQFDSARRPAAGRSIRCAHQQDEHNNIQHQLHQHQPHRLIRCFSSSGEKDKDLSSDNTSAGENNANDIETVDKDDEDDKSATGSEEAYVGTDNENTEDDESTVKDTESTTNNDQQTPGYFPWRHDSEVPTRILEKNDFSGMPNNYRSRFVRRLVACRELDISPLAAIGPIPFFARSWETEMANNFAIAFELALEELLKSIFHEDRIQVKNRRADDQVIIVDSSVKSDADSDVDTSNNLDKNEYLNSMMDKKLIAKYQSVNTDNFHLKLSIKPTEAILESIFAM